MGSTRTRQKFAYRPLQSDSRNGQGEDRPGDADKREDTGEQKDGRGDRCPGLHPAKGGCGGNQGRHQNGTVAAFLRGVQAALGYHSPASLYPP